MKIGLFAKEGLLGFWGAVTEIISLLWEFLKFVWGYIRKWL